MGKFWDNLEEYDDINSKISLSDAFNSKKLIDEVK